MSKDTFGTKEVIDPQDSITTATVVEEREITSQFVSDGVYKYVYVDTGEDYNP